MKKKNPFAEADGLSYLVDYVSEVSNLVMMKDVVEIFDLVITT
jgi:hypothetical protein